MEVLMKLTTLLIAAIAVLAFAGEVRSAEFDAGTDIMCGNQASEHWSYTAYRVSDGAHRSLAYGRAPIAEISKYGADAFYLPDGGQELRPFFVKLGDMLYCSPAFTGPAYDASIAWTSPTDGEAGIEGSFEFVGSIGEKSPTGSVTATLLVDGDAVWTHEVGPGGPVKLNRAADVKKGSVVELRIGNGSGDGPKITKVDLRVAVP